MDDLLLLGKGTYASVYRRRGVAVKRTSLDGDGVPFTSVREVDILLSLRHPHVMEILKVDIRSCCLELSMPCCPKTLAALISAHPRGIGPALFWSLALQLADALAYVHSQCVVHRDVKPSNLLVDQEGKLKLADFGLARRVYPGEERLLTREVVSIWYRSPELLLSRRYSYSSGVDVWSLGCVLYEAATGRPLFPHKTEKHMVNAILATFGRVALSAAFPKESFPGSFAQHECTFDSMASDVCALVKRALCCDPGRRPSCGELLALGGFKSVARVPLLHEAGRKRKL